jgi:hypothetical protein
LECLCWQSIPSPALMLWTRTPYLFATYNWVRTRIRRLICCSFLFRGLFITRLGLFLFCSTYVLSCFFYHSFGVWLSGVIGLDSLRFLFIFIFWKMLTSALEALVKELNTV